MSSAPHIPANKWSREAATDEEDRHISVDLFKGNFLSFLESGTLSDVVVKTSDSQEYHVHRIILAYSSDFFNRLFTGEFKEARQGCVELKFPDAGRVFPEVLRFMYSGQVDISPENAIPLLGMADQYLINELKDRVRNYISLNITKQNCLATLRQVLTFRVADQQILSKCMTTVAKNFSILAETESFSFMPVSNLLGLLNHELLAVKNEWVVFKAVATYIKERSEIETLTPEQTKETFKCVRFAFLSYPQLKEAESYDVVPRDLLIEGLLYRLRRTECPDVHDDGMMIVPRPAYGLHFEYKYNYDGNGILAYYHGSGPVTGHEVNELTFETSACTVTCSSIEKGTVADFILNKRSEAWTKDVPSSWLCFDFGEHRNIVTNYYTLTHGGNYKADSLRNWDFQGSNDGVTWRVLRRHTNDNSLYDKFKSASWPVDTHQAYRMFRIVQNGALLLAPTDA